MMKDLRADVSEAWHNGGRTEVILIGIGVTLTAVSALMTAAGQILEAFGW